MQNENDSAKSKHLESAASALKRFILKNNSQLIDALLADLDTVSSAILDSVPSNQDGALWYETQNDSPVIKFFQGGFTYSLSPTLEVSDPQLSLSPATQTISSGNATINVNYLGSGTVSWKTDPSGSKYFPSSPYYDDTNKKIIVPYSSYVAQNNGTGDVTVSVTLSEATGYSAASADCIVTMPDSGPLKPGDSDGPA